MAAGIPQAVWLTCPRCKTGRSFINIDGGVTFRCAGCEWTYSLSAQAPTGTSTATTGQGATAITVASGGASFTLGMQLLWDTASNAEVVTVSGTPGATNIPVTAAIKAHSSGAAFGQLLISPTDSGVGQDQVPNVAGWGF